MKKAVLIVAAVLLAGCGAGPNAPAAPPTPYGGPLKVTQSFADSATVLQRSGAAGQALECTGSPFEGGGADYSSGLEEVRPTVSAALDSFMTQHGTGPNVPEDGYRVEREDGRRVLMSYDIDSRTVVAFTLADGIKDYLGQRGWGVESWAQCDPSELPDRSPDEGVQIWTTADGSRVPTGVLNSWTGAEHCEWQYITFLQLGEHPDNRMYVRDVAGTLREHTVSGFERAAELPKDARDLGFRRDGRELWIAADQSSVFLVGPGGGQDIERWPRATTAIGCA